VLVEAPLGHVRVGACLDPLANVVFRPVRGDNDHGQRRADRVGPDRASQLQAADLGHLQVGDHERDRRLAAQRVERLAAVTRRQDLVARGFQDAALELPGGKRVLDDQDHRGGRGLGRGCRARPGDLGQPDQQRVRLDQQRDPAVAEHGRAEELVGPRQQRAKRFDRDLLLADERVAGDRDAELGHPDDQSGCPGRQRRRRRPDQRSDIGERHGPAAHG